MIGYSWSFILTPVAKVLVQNIRSFFDHLKATRANQKLLGRLRILCSFWIWAWKFCVWFCSRVVGQCLKGLKNWFVQSGWTEVAEHDVCLFFTCLNVFQTSEKRLALTRISWSFQICARELGTCFCLKEVKKSLNDLKIGFTWWRNRYLLTPINCSVMMLKSVGASSFVEKTFLFKMWCRTKLKLETTSIFSRAAFLCKTRQWILLNYEL
jgi:hypothetical protein